MHNSGADRNRLTFHWYTYVLTTSIHTQGEKAGKSYSVMKKIVSNKEGVYHGTGKK